MGDDKRARAEFPFAGDYIKAYQPTPEQMVLLMMAGTNVDPRVLRRILGVAESIVGEHQWDRIEKFLLGGQASVQDLMELVLEVMKFDWPKKDTDSRDEASAPVEIEKAIAPSPTARLIDE